MPIAAIAPIISKVNVHNYVGLAVNKAVQDKANSYVTIDMIADVTRNTNFNEIARQVIHSLTMDCTQRYIAQIQSQLSVSAKDILLNLMDETKLQIAGIICAPTTKRRGSRTDGNP